MSQANQLRGSRGLRVHRVGMLSLAVTLLLTSCGVSSQAREREEEKDPETVEVFAGPAVICGTAIEASTGLPLAGVQIEGPGGVQGQTDEDGRFELPGLATGLEGLLLARTDEGLSGQNRLRPLSSGRLEVVIYLR